MQKRTNPPEIHWEDLAMVVIDKDFTGYVMDTYCKDFEGEKKEAFEQRFREIWWNNKRWEMFEEMKKERMGNDQGTEAPAAPNKAH